MTQINLRRLWLKTVPNGHQPGQPLGEILETSPGGVPRLLLDSALP